MPEQQPSPEEAIQSLLAQIAERLQRGERPEAIRTELLSRGVRPDLADRVLAGFAPGKWETGSRGWALRILGILVAMGGGFLFFGNQIGFFPTFPFAGTIVTLIGAGLYVFGGGKG